MSVNIALRKRDVLAYFVNYEGIEYAKKNT